MQNLKSISIIAALVFLCMLFNSCQKGDLSNLITNEQTNLQSLHLKSGSSSDYLINLIEKIKNLVSEGTLSESEGKSLITKIENAIRSMQTENKNALKGQLNAVINQVESLINRGILTPEQGQPLVNVAEGGIILTQGTFVDSRDGQTYKVVSIGSQLWMAENLKSTFFTDRTPIPNVMDATVWTNLQSAAYCIYNNDESVMQTNGALYNWYVVSQE